MHGVLLILDYARRAQIAYSVYFGWFALAVVGLVQLWHRFRLSILSKSMIGFGQ